MNEVLEQLYKRKSVRIYEEIEISEEHKEVILEAAMQAPTAGNMMMYSIIDVKSQELKDKLAVSCDNQPFIAKAPMVLIFLADYERLYDSYMLCGEEIRKPGEGDLFLACADALIAAQNAVVAAESLGIGSCYIGDILENYETHREILNLPEYVFPAAMLCLGYPTENQKVRKKPLRFDKKYIVYEDGYKKQSPDELKEMFKQWRIKNGFEYRGHEEEVGAMYKRKYESDFSKEMTRSAREYLKAWSK